MALDRSVTAKLFGEDKTLGKTMGKAGKQADGLKGKLGAIAGAAAGAFAVKAGFDFLRGSVREADEAQRGMDALANSVARNTKLGPGATAAFAAQAGALQKVTSASDDSIIAGQATLATFSLTQSQIGELTPLIVDYARKFKTDMPTAAKLFGRAATGNVGALSRLGIQVDKTKAKADPFGTTLDALRKKAGGFASQEGKTLGGRMEIMRNRFGEVQEKIGTALIPVLIKLGDFLTDKVIPAVEKTAEFLSKHKNVVVPLVVAIGSLVAILKIATVVQAALNAVMALNPFVAIAILIIALGAALVIAYKKSETFRNIVNGVFRAVLGAAGDMVAALVRGFRMLLMVWLNVAHGILKGATGAFGWVPGLGGKLKKANKAFGEMKDSILGTLEDVADSADGWGEKVAKSYASGIRRSIPDVASAAKAAGQSVTSYLRQDSPAEKGPLSKAGGTYGMGRKAGILFDKGLRSALPTRGAAAHAAFAGASAAGGGGQTIHVVTTLNGRVVGEEMAKVNQQRRNRGQFT